MKIVKIVFSLFCICFYVTAFSQRTKYNFNSDWKVFVGDEKGAEVPDFNDASWKSVTLPYAWNEDEAFRKDIRDLSTGIAWYRKTFKLPASAKGQKVFLEFEGIRQAGDFYFNGKHIGIHENGVTAFGFDVTDLVKFDEPNIIAARIDNDWDYRERATKQKYQWEDKNFNANYGGINKNVFLHLTNKIYQTLPLWTHLNTTGVYVYATDYDIKAKSAIIHTESEIKNESIITQEVSYEVIITDLNDKPVKKIYGDKIRIRSGEIRIVKASALVNDLNFCSP